MLQFLLQKLVLESYFHVSITSYTTRGVSGISFLKIHVTQLQTNTKTLLHLRTFLHSTRVTLILMRFS
uniref:Uncharacterized protein n=1 Tax=Physcomitrium patens TaxID=3218 RepID=A0A7I3ZY49_PHYPA